MQIPRLNCRAQNYVLSFFFFFLIHKRDLKTFFPSHLPKAKSNFSGSTIKAVKPQRQKIKDNKHLNTLVRLCKERSTLGVNWNRIQLILIILCHYGLWSPRGHPVREYWITASRGNILLCSWEPQATLLSISQSTYTWLYGAYLLNSI